MKKFGCVLDAEFEKELRNSEKKKKNTWKKRLYYPVFKRFADIVCSLVALIVLAILFPFIYIAIKVDSKGPVIFTQLRVGQFGHLFKIYKLRTMYQDAEQHIEKNAFKDKHMPFIQHDHDPRVTKVGHFLRKFSIDELPQLFCVLRGTMSFIGPRPYIPEETSVLTQNQLRRLTVKPGLTGLAQINGRGHIPLEDRINYDLEYIDTMSAWLDIKILWKTIWSVLIKDHGM